MKKGDPINRNLKKARRISKKLCAQYGVINPPDVEVLPYSRLGECVALGYYDNEINRVEINKYLLLYGMMQTVRETIQHELVHALCYQEYGHGGHDADFRALCNKLGLIGDVRLSRKK